MLGPVEETTLGSSVYLLVFPKNQGHETPLSYLLELSVYLLVFPKNQGHETPLSYLLELSYPQFVFSAGNNLSQTHQCLTILGIENKWFI